MSEPVRSVSKRWWVVGIGLVVLLVLLACGKETPSAPLRDNPLDQGNPQTSGDPYGLSLEETPGGLRLRWSQVIVPGIAGYRVYRRVDDGAFVVLGSVDEETTTLEDPGVADGHDYAYYVTVRGGDGDESAVAASTPVSWRAAPMVAIGDAVSSYVARHAVTLQVQAFGAVRMQLATEPSFAGAMWEVYRPSRAWQLTDGLGERQVYVRVVYTSGDTSRVSWVSVTVVLVADAGLDQEVAYGTLVQLDGGGSYSPDGAPLSYVWRSLSGLELSDASSSSPSFTALSWGEYRFELVVSDGVYDSAPDTVVVTVQVETPAGTVHEMVQVPAGEFEMGSVSGDSSERPVHAVYLDGYHINKYEVTNLQWNAFASSTGTSSKSGPSDHPVVRVTWYEARDYCVWAGLRLPTEAEWEKAARGTDQLTYPWGEGLDGGKANYRNSGDSYDNGTTPVGHYPLGVSPYGVYDMSGNAWEWVADWYDAGYYAISPFRSPLGPTSGTDRVLRGGSWLSNPTYLRSSSRYGNNPTNTNYYYGFRCAQDE